MNFQELTQLSDLLDQSHKAAEAKGTTVSDPFVQKHPTEQYRHPQSVDVAPKAVQTKKSDIWDDADIEQKDAVIHDSRAVPEHEIVFHQTLSASEAYGGFGMMTPASADSDALNVVIQLPGEDASSIDVDVTATNLALHSTRYRLVIPLPQPVDESATKAKWDASKEQLTVTVKLL